MLYQRHAAGGVGGPVPQRCREDLCGSTVGTLGLWILDLMSWEDKDMWTPVVNNDTMQWAQAGKQHRMHGLYEVGLRLEGDICKLISDVPGHKENFNGWGELRPYTVPLATRLPFHSLRNTSTADPTRHCCCLRSPAASRLLSGLLALLALQL